MADDDESQDWQPPSEAQHKILEARRERQNKISKLIGDYLLKGYKMLATVCPECETILMRSRQGTEDYCVACSELDSDSTKDDPVLSSTAAHRRAQEQQAKLEPPDHDDVEPVLRNGGDAYATLPSASMPSGDRRINSTPSGDYHIPTSAAAAMFPTSSRAETTNGTGSQCTTQYPITLSASVDRCPDSGCAAEDAGSRFVIDRHGDVNNVSVVDAASVLYGRLDWATTQLKQTQSVEGSVQLCDLIRGCADAILALRRLQHSNNSLPDH